MDRDVTCLVLDTIAIYASYAGTRTPTPLTHAYRVFLPLSQRDRLKQQLDGVEVKCEPSRLVVPLVVHEGASGPHTYDWTICLQYDVSSAGQFQL